MHTHRRLEHTYSIRPRAFTRSDETIDKLASVKVKLIWHAWPHLKPHKANSSHGEPIDLIGIKGAHPSQVIPCGALARYPSSPSVQITFSALAGEGEPTRAKPHWVVPHSERDGQLTNYEDRTTHPSHVCACDMARHVLESLILPMQILFFFFFFLPHLIQHALIHKRITANLVRLAAGLSFLEMGLVETCACGGKLGSVKYWRWGFEWNDCFRPRCIFHCAWMVEGGRGVSSFSPSGTDARTRWTLCGMTCVERLLRHWTGEENCAAS